MEKAHDDFSEELPNLEINNPKYGSPGGRQTVHCAPQANRGPERPRLRRWETHLDVGRCARTMVTPGTQRAGGLPTLYIATTTAPGGPGQRALVTRVGAGSARELTRFPRWARGSRAPPAGHCAADVKRPNAGAGAPCRSPRSSLPADPGSSWPPLALVRSLKVWGVGSGTPKRGALIAKT